MWEVAWRELKDRKWFLLAYCLGSILLLWIYVATFKSSAASTASLKVLVKSYPKAFLEAFGLDNLDIDTLEKYLKVEYFSFLWPIMAVILALARSAGQIAGEIQNGTMGLLLATPLPRWRIFLAKYMAGIATVIIFTAVSVFMAIPLAAAAHVHSHPRILFCAFLLVTLFMWAVYSIGLAVSAWVSDRGRVYAICGALVLASYTANIVAMINSHFSWLKYYSLFFYFDTQKVLSTGEISLRTYGYFICVIAVATGLALWRYDQRDIAV